MTGKRLCAALLIAAALFSLAACTGAPTRRLPLRSGSIRVEERAEGGLSQRIYEDEYGCRFTMAQYRYDSGETRAYTFYRETVPADGRLRLYDPASDSWSAQPLQEGEYRCNIAVLELPDGGTRFFYLPKTYISHPHDVLEHQPALNGQMELRRTENGFDVAVTGRGDAESFCTEFAMLSAPMRVLDWDGDNWAVIWNRYTDDGEAKWCYSGYYRFTPENYEPTGENFYYRCPATFLAREIRWQIGKSVAAQIVTVAMLDTVMQTQNARGYFPTMPKSGWLSADYGVGYDFYDTRFNTDLMDAVIDLREQLGGSLFQTELDRYAAFYREFAAQHHAETENGGWLVADYWSEDMAKEPHTSLNHQLAECLLLYKLRDVCGDDACGALAERLLQAVRDTAQDWVREDHNLHYCRYADGAYGAQDYPDLTHKDLVALRKYLLRKHYREEPQLDMLIREKRIWMDANGVAY